MTANIRIVTAEKKAVLAVPYRALTQRDDGLYATVRSATTGKDTEKKIEVGLRDDFGDAEIVSGLNEGDIVVMPATTQ